MYVFGELKCVVKEVCADRLQTSLEKSMAPWSTVFEITDLVDSPSQLCWLEARDLWR
jgi:hypothetical protein